MKSSSSSTPSSADFVWRELLTACYHDGDQVGPRGFLTRELLNTTALIRMSEPLVLHPMRNLSYKHACNEALWILTGSNQLEMIKRTAPSYARFSDNGRTLQGAYGPPVTEQMRYVVDTLSQDRESRQAVISIWRPNPRESRDIPCTLSLQFLIRDLKIHCIATMRSSDTWLGFPYDVFCFTMISVMVALQLPANVDLGTLRLTAGSQHLYDKDRINAEPIIRTVCGREISDLSLQGLSTPDDLLNALQCGVDASLMPKHGNQFFADLLHLIAEQEGA